MYDTADCATSTSEYGHYVYAHALDFFSSNTISREEAIFMYYVRIRGNLLAVVESQRRYPKTIFVIDDACLTTFRQHV